jgi:hypothetical protein
LSRRRKDTASNSHSSSASSHFKQKWRRLWMCPAQQNQGRQLDLRDAYRRARGVDRLRVLRDVSGDDNDCGAALHWPWFLEACRNQFKNGLPPNVRRESPWFVYLCKAISRLLKSHPELRRNEARFGRPTGPSDKTWKILRAAAAFVVCGRIQKEMAPHLFPDKPGSCVANTNQLFFAHRLEISAWEKRLTRAKASRIVKQWTIDPSA